MKFDSKERDYDAVVVGAGPNGLSAAVELARSGRSVLVVEAADTVGGGARTQELTLPGFKHDVCSSIYPLGVGSPFFKTLPLEEHGLEWVHPPNPLAHPFDDGTAALLRGSVDETAYGMDKDTASYARLMRPLVGDWDVLSKQFLGPIRPSRHPFAMARFGIRGLRSGYGLAKSKFAGEHAQGLFGGLAAHSMMPIEQRPTAAFGLMLGLAGHAVGWPLARGGSQSISDALTSHLTSLGGEIVTGVEVTDLDDLPPSRAVLCDVTPRQLLRIAGSRISGRYRRGLSRYRYGVGVFKVDWALDGPIPWTAPECHEAASVHLGGTLDEVARSERAIWKGEHPDRPFVILAQTSLFDPTRAPQGKHTAWAYCHVPNGSTVDMTSRIEDQIERFAPGFKELVLARAVKAPADVEAYNANYIGGDINGGVQDLRQLFTRPVMKWDPYSTSAKGLYICSSSTPPGGGVHGMCGYHAARSALGRDLR